MMTVQTVEELMASSQPRPLWKHSSLLILLGLSMLLGALMANPNLIAPATPLAWLLPHALLLALIAVMVGRSVHQRRLGRLMAEGLEAVQVRQWPRAAEMLGRLLRHPLRYPVARAESLLGLAAVAEAGHAYEASQRIYEALLAENAASPLQLHNARVALATAMLRTSRTTDAVELIDRLERADLPPPLRAQVELVSLFRELTMGQTQDGIARADLRRQLFRDYLSTRAGYGYALLAAAFDRAGQPERARRYWHDATMLVRPQGLVDCFCELHPMAEKFPPAEVPW